MRSYGAGFNRPIAARLVRHKGDTVARPALLPARLRAGWRAPKGRHTRAASAAAHRSEQLAASGDQARQAAYPEGRWHTATPRCRCGGVLVRLGCGGRLSPSTARPHHKRESGRSPRHRANTGEEPVGRTASRCRFAETLVGKAGRSESLQLRRRLVGPSCFPAHTDEPSGGPQHSSQGAEFSTLLVPRNPCHGLPAFLACT